MAKLVVLSEGLTGRSHELKVDKTTIGRVEDNTFPIPEASVSSHHCEVFQRGNDVIIKDLNSTNGTFVNGQQITGEAVLKPGQIFRLGQIELRLETDDVQATPAAKKLPDQTMVIPRGVSMTELEQGTRPVTFDKNSPFAKKSNQGTKLFYIGAAVLIVIVFGVIVYFILQTGQVSPPQ